MQPSTMGPREARRGPASSPDQRRDGEVIGLVGLAHGTSHFFHLMLPPLFPWLMAEFSLSYTDVGLLTTTLFVISGVGQAVAGFVVDRVGALRVLCFGIAMLALSGVVLAFATSYAWLLTSAAVAGAGNSIFHPADFTLLNHRVNPARLGHAFSVHGVSGSLGWAAAPVFMAGITSVAGWHVAGLGAAAVGAAVFAALLLRRRTLARGGDDLGAAPAAAGRLHGSGGHFAFLSSGAVWLSFAFFLFATMAFGILQNYAPAILGHVYGVSFVLASSGLTAYLLGSGSGMLAAGFLGERADRIIAPSLAFAALMAGALASGVLPSVALWPLMAGVGFGVGMAGPGRDLLVRRAAASRFGARSFGRVYGFVYSGLDTGQALSPVLFGPLLDAGGFRQALAAVALLQVAALVIALRVRSRVGAPPPQAAAAAAIDSNPGGREV